MQSISENRVGVFHESTICKEKCPNSRSSRDFFFFFFLIYISFRSSVIQLTLSSSPLMKFSLSPFLSVFSFADLVIVFEGRLKVWKALIVEFLELVSESGHHTSQAIVTSQEVLTTTTVDQISSTFGDTK